MSGYLDPSLTDDEITTTFTPAERCLHEWYENDGLFRDFGPGKTISGLQAMFPDIENLHESLMIFSDKWLQRKLRRRMVGVSRSSLLTRIRETSCRDPQHLQQTILAIQMGNVPDLLVGESRFGGTLTGYAIQVNPRAFHPDEPINEISDAESTITLDPAIVAIDIDTISSQPSSLPSPPALSAAQKRRRENRSSGEDSTASMRSANSDDFLDTEPDVFYQVGTLMSCAGENWMKIRDKPVREIPPGTTWEHTGYSVVVKLNRNGYPTGPVFAIYAFSYLEPTMDGLEIEEIEWRDRHRQESLHVRSLYTGCDTKFFLAQMAEKLENLDDGVEFDFDIKSEKKCVVQLTKLAGVGPSQMIIPHQVFDTTGSSENKRSHMESIDESG